MKKIKLVLVVVLSLIFSRNIFAQEKQNYYDFSQWGEVYFSFNIDNNEDLNKLSQIISIDKYSNGSAIAYANEKTFNEFLQFGYKPIILQHPSTIEEVEMYTLEQFNSKDIYEWDSYPTYPAYLAMMEEFETEFPDLCSLINIGKTVQHRDLLFCKLTSNQNPTTKTRVLWISSIHGDETTGYVLMLRLIDYLLNNYGSDPRTTNMLDNMEIWICPLSNPDGTYHGGNNSVNGSQRYNANYVDLNRNYKDDVYGDHPDGNSWQPETVAFMNLADSVHFTLGINFHGGEEVCNYPWDNKSQRHADDDWWRFVCREFADTCHVYNSQYMTVYQNGITNGYDWYSISGGRQDNSNYFKRCREFTCEISNNKTLPANQLPNHWNWLHRSFFNYLDQSLYGIHGTVTDSESGQPVNCRIFIEGHDVTNSDVYTDSFGYYSRPIKAGTYDVSYNALGYDPITIPITITDKQTIIQDVQLDYSGITIAFEADKTEIALGGTVHFTDGSFSHDPIISYSWEFPGGNPSTSNVQNPTVIYNSEGQYDVTLTIFDGNETKTLVKEDYINVTNMYLMQNGTFTTCNGLFYDNGGPDNNYGDSKNFTMTFTPSTPGAQMVVTFISFTTEAGYDKLFVYNGPTISSPSLGSFSGSTIPGPFTSTATDGSLTFKFTSDYSANYAGWKAVLSCLGGFTCEAPDLSAELDVEDQTPIIQLSWDEIDNATEYNVYYNNTLLNTTPDPFYAISDIESGNYYCYTVSAVCAEGESDMSNEVCTNFLFGDANNDLAVNVTDIMTVVSKIVGNNPHYFSFVNADVNLDGNINVLDIIGIVNIITEGKFDYSNCHDSDDSVVYTIKDGILFIESSTDLSGIQILIKSSDIQSFELLPSVSSLVNSSTTVSSSEYMFLAYSIDNTGLPMGKHEIMKLNNAEIEEAIFSNPSGCKIRAVDGNSLGITEKESVIGHPYPVPFTNEVVIPYIVKSPIINSAEMIFSNVNGQIFGRYNVDSTIGEHSFTWTPSNIESGIYFVTLRINGIDIQHSKLIK